MSFDLGTVVEVDKSIRDFVESSSGQSIEQFIQRHKSMDCGNGDLELNQLALERGNGAVISEYTVKNKTLEIITVFDNTGNVSTQTDIYLED